jgi:hypothetical protein
LPGFRWGFAGWLLDAGDFLETDGQSPPSDHAANAPGLRSVEASAPSQAVFLSPGNLATTMLVPKTQSDDQRRTRVQNERGNLVALGRSACATSSHPNRSSPVSHPGRWRRWASVPPSS